MWKRLLVLSVLCGLGTIVMAGCGGQKVETPKNPEPPPQAAPAESPTPPPLPEP